MNNDTAFTYLLSVLSDTEDNQHLQRILSVLMTDKEQQELVNRLKIFALLQQGKTQREISAQLGVGIATVSRGAKEMKDMPIAEIFPNLVHIDIG